VLAAPTIHRILLLDRRGEIEDLSMDDPLFLLCLARNGGNRHRAALAFARWHPPTGAPEPGKTST
jgi:hypothetical protein